MTKKKSIFLLVLVSLLLVVLTVASFARFPVGVYDYNSFLGAISLDYDMEGGTAYTLTLADDNTEDIETDADVKSVTDILSARMNALGYKNYKITTLKDMTPTTGAPDYAIRITAKSSNDFASDISVVASYGELTFYGGTESNPTTVIMDEEPAIAGASAFTDNSTGSDVHQVQVKLTDYGYNTLVSAIEGASGSYYLMVKLGDNTLINGSITTDAIQNGSIYLTSDTIEDANRMALQLSTGGLKYKYKVSDAQSVSAILGENTSLYAIIAISTLIVAAIVFFTVKYKGFGLIAGLSLYTFVLVMISMLIAVPGIVVSLGGVAGIILASVLAIDGLIITFKRITEENELGKTVKAAVKMGYKRALFPILNTNVIALAIGLALFAFTTGTLYNFAVIFSIGVAISFATNVLISRMFTVLILPLLKKPEKFLKLKRVVD